MSASRPAVARYAHLEWNRSESGLWEKAGGGELGHSVQSLTSKS